MEDRLMKSGMQALALTAVLAMALPIPAQAQFGSLLRSRPSSSGKTATGCDDSAGKAAGRSVIGGVLGGWRAARGCPASCRCPRWPAC